MLQFQVLFLQVLLQLEYLQLEYGILVMEEMVPTKDWEM